MKKHKDILYTLLGVAAIAGLIFWVYQSKSPEPVVIKVSHHKKLSDEHQHITKLLQSPEIEPVESNIVPRVVSVVPEEVPGEISDVPVGVNSWEQTAVVTNKDSLGRIELDGRERMAPEISFDGLRSDEYVEPLSQENRQIVRTLLDKRKLQVKEY